MRSNPFSPLKSNKSSPSNNPKSVLNRRNDHKKRGLDAALHRADRRFRVNKSRALEKLHKDKKFISLSEIAQGVREKEIIGKLEDKRDAEKLGLEKEWLRKSESGEIAHDEDDLMSCDDEDDEKAESEEGWRSRRPNQDLLLMTMAMTNGRISMMMKRWRYGVRLILDR